MKKGIVISIIMLMMSAMSFANEEPTFVGTQIELEVGHNEPVEGEPQRPRSPITVPIVYTDGISIFFYTPCDGYTLYIKDTGGDVCYETVVPYRTEEFTLPEYLSGEYEIILSNGSCDFVGSIII